VPTALFDRARFRLVEVNAALEALTGRSREELIGLDPTVVAVGEDGATAVLPSWVERRRGPWSLYETAIVHVTGVRRHVELAVRDIPGTDLELWQLIDLTEV
jgi:PAS domain S-box-containing protein